MNKRIKVELEFIPVEERLPEEEQECFTLDSNGGISMDFFEMCLRSGTVVSAWCEELNDGKTYWTHWAEIPKMEDLV